MWKGCRPYEFLLIPIIIFIDGFGTEKDPTGTNNIRMIIIVVIFFRLFLIIFPMMVVDGGGNGGYGCFVLQTKFEGRKYGFEIMVPVLFL